MALTFRKFFESKDILITEANTDEVYQRYYKDVIDKEIFDRLANTFRKNYQLRWAIDAYKNLTNDGEKKRFINEDLSNLRKLFEKLEFFKQKNVPEAKSLNVFSFKSIPELYRAIEDMSEVKDPEGGQKTYAGGDSLQQTREAHKGEDGFLPNLEKLYENGMYIVVRPEDEKSLNALSRKTGWCTDVEKDDYHGTHYFEGKNKRGNNSRLYYIQNKTSKKDRWLLYFLNNEHQIMDRSNHDHSDELEKLNPELQDAIFNLGDIDEVTEEIEASPRSAATFYILMEIMGK
jgi:hypothetical protein